MKVRDIIDYISEDCYLVLQVEIPNVLGDTIIHEKRIDMSNEFTPMSQYLNLDIITISGDSYDVKLKVIL